jgi:DNA-binding transcriptional regulator YiaG
MTPAAFKAWREARLISRSDLAKMLFVDAFTVWRWEDGSESIPPFMSLTLEKLILPAKDF